MPVVNSRGHIIQEKILSVEDQARLSWLASLKFDINKDIILHLSPRDFYSWIHSQPPQEIFSLDFVNGLSTLFEKQAKPCISKRVKDFFWRMFH